jgi:hypothetical protein
MVRNEDIATRASYLPAPFSGNLLFHLLLSMKIAIKMVKKCIVHLKAIWGET